MSQVGVFVLSPIQWLWWGQIPNCEGGQISKQNQNQNPKNPIQNTKLTPRQINNNDVRWSFGLWHGVVGSSRMQHQWIQLENL